MPDDAALEAGIEHFNTSAFKLAVNAKHALVLEDGTGRVLMEKNADQVVPIASLTKLVTAMVVLDARLDAKEALRGRYEFVIDGMAERDIPLSVFHFDCFWMREFQWCDFAWDPRGFPEPEAMLERLCQRAEDAVRGGYNIIILSDRAVSAERVPIPALLATSATHHHLIRKGLRTQVGQPASAPLAALSAAGVEPTHAATPRLGAVPRPRPGSATPWTNDATPAWRLLCQGPRRHFPDDGYSTPSAWAKSSCRSSISSMPTETLTNPSLMPARWRSTGVMERWVVRLGMQTRLSTPPRLKAGITRRSWLNNRSTRAGSCSSKESIPPNPRICREAMAWSG